MQAYSNDIIGRLTLGRDRANLRKQVSRTFYRPQEKKMPVRENVQVAVSRTPFCASSAFAEIIALGQKLLPLRRETFFISIWVLAERRKKTLQTMKLYFNLRS